MTLKNNRAPLLCCFQLCAWFHCHMWIQTGVRVRKRKVGCWPLWLWPLTLTFCMDITSDHGNNSSKFHDDDTMMGTWWKRCDRRTDRQTDGQTDGRTDGLNQSYSCFVAAKTIADQAPVPLTELRANLKFNHYLECSGLKCAQPITTKFYTCHDSITVVMCAKFCCDQLNMLWATALQIFIEF